MWSFLVVAAGQSSRMAGADKLTLMLHGRPVLWHALHALRATGWFEQGVVVTTHARRDLLLAAGLGRGCPVAWVEGGARRQDSVAAGLEYLAGLPRLAMVAIHDGARPCVDPDLVRRVLDAAERVGAAAPGIPVSDTVRELAAGDMAGSIVDRHGLVRMQTPQAFGIEPLLQAHRRLAALGQEVSDDVAAYQLLGQPVAIVPGSPRNIKLTTPDDLPLARVLLRARS